jgi:predicted alpha-1,2-mannosidase
MKKLVWIFYVVLGFSASGKIPNQLTAFRSHLVNPFIGTGGHGHTFPGPTMPFGGCQVGPDTRLSGWDGCSGYHYSDSIIYGFTHTHLSGTGCSDYGDILLMPTTTEVGLDHYQYASSFSHKKEVAYAGYYEVMLKDPNILVQLTATPHGGVHQYIYPTGASRYVVLDLQHRDEVLDSKMEKVDDYTLRGHRFSKAWATNQKVFFEIRFSEKIANIQYEALPSGSETTAIQTMRSRRCLIEFEPSTPSSSNSKSKLLVRCAISSVDESGAHKNLEREMMQENFPYYLRECERAWESELSKINLNKFEALLSLQAPSKKISPALRSEAVIFYTALYHSMIHPSLASDVDGRYRGRDDNIHNTNGAFDYYSVFSLWDTYRALHPLLTIIDRKRTNDFIQTFIRQYEEGGRLPIWELSSNETNCMIGYHVVSVIWDAYNKGIRNYDVEKAFEAMKSIATRHEDYAIANGILTMKEGVAKRSADAQALQSYNQYGMVRSDDSHESVSKTLEYAYNDWCIAQMAKSLHKEEDYQYYMHRSHYWKNVFDPGTKFMRARKNGGLYEPFSPYTVDNNYTEANSWQYSFSVPHDVPGLIALHGNAANFENHLDKLFLARTKTEGREQADITGLIGQYAHGNEPSHHIPFLYHILGKTIKTNQKVIWILSNFYKNAPDGLIGNEDCGQMSAWYVLASMGLYSFCPGSADFLLFDQTRFKQVSFTDVDLKAVNGVTTWAHPKNNTLKLTFATLSFPIQTNEEANNPALNYTEHEFVPSPFLGNAKRIFDGAQTIKMGNIEKEHPLFYSINQSDYKRYTKPVVIQGNSKISFYAKNTNGDQSPVQEATCTVLPKDRQIILQNQYNKSYHAGGAQGLMDGIYGKENWRAGEWQGYQGEDVGVIMRFTRTQTIQRIAANFLEDQNSWIFYPKQVEFYYSNDSTQWTLLKKINTLKSDHELTTTISKFSHTLPQPIQAKYVKMIARNFGPMPQWHEGRNNPTFIFIDELEVE